MWLPQFFDVFRKWVCVQFALTDFAGGVGRVDDDASDDEKEKYNETDPKHDSLKFEDAKVLEDHLA